MAAGRVWPAFAALLLGGCAFGPQLGQVAVDHNRMVAQSTDELTLLNIVRASHRFPLHFTAITQVNGSVTLNAGAELGIGLDPVVDPQNAGLSSGIETNPSYQAAVLATEQFQRGIQAPLDPELVAYYLGEGWRDGLLMALTIEQVEVKLPGGAAPRIIVNRADAGSEFSQLLCTYELWAQPSPGPVQLARFSDLIDRQMLASPATTPAARRDEITALLALLGNAQVRLNGDELVLAHDMPNTAALRERPASRCANTARDPTLAGATLTPRFRSTLGIIYFLGEYQRKREVEGQNAVYTIPHCGEDCRAGRRQPEARPLIAIERGEGTALLATEFEDTRYYIPQAELDGYLSDTANLARSMQVLALVEQLVNLQKSADELPTTLSVSTVN